MAAAILIGLCASGGAFAAEPIKIDKINFDRDIRPILSDTCFACHGPDDAKRKANLRFDLRKSAFAPRESGAALVPGNPSQSTLYRRITSNDPDERMPPPDSGRQLTREQIAVVGRWIEQGAKWEEHWSLVAPRRSPPPFVRDPRWARNPIDRFVLARLDREGLSPSAPADRATLIRRATLDLTGLPPTPREVEAFVNDPSPNAYERVVDRLLASPRYGERMAIRWLDAARYADTNGYQTDGERSMWRWRDWVIDALNANVPFDQFTVEQIAGDMLPNASLDQKIASGFNRNLRGNGEGGIIPEEYLVEYAVDRVETTATVWLGLTLGCARCHDHKYDPLRQIDFYKVLAYFNNVPEPGRAIKVGNSPPLIKAPTVADQKTLSALEARRAKARRDLASRAQELAESQARWEHSDDARQASDWGPVHDLLGHWAFDGNVNGMGKTLPAAKLEGAAIEYVSGPFGKALRLDGRASVNAGNVAAYGYFDTFSVAAWIHPADAEAGTILSRMVDVEEGDGYSLAIKGGKLHTNLVARWLDDAIRLETAETIDCAHWHHVAMTYDGSRKAQGVRLYLDGRLQPVRIELDELNQSFAKKEPLRIGGGGGPAARFRGALDEVRVYDRVLDAEEVSILATPEPLAAICALPVAKRSPGQTAKLHAYFLENRAPQPIRDALRLVRWLDSEIERFADAFPTVMIMKEMNPRRETHVLIRGQYDHPGQKVTAGVPASLPALKPTLPNSRLGFARWLVDGSNPLTARVAVNRQWQLFFGGGLVRTTEDFGSQGDRPSHPELLDWLATEFVRLGWDVKQLQRAIVMSATYRQSSNVTRSLIERDPQNRLLARGPRMRLSAEMIRDQALAASSLLVERVGGPSVRPYQPAGLWKDLSGAVYRVDSGPSLYRRGMYTFWKRTIAPPAMLAFDASTRETCTVRETRTNTPLQALNLMNDVTYVEAARNLAERALRKPAATVNERIDAMFQIVVARKPTVIELRIVRASHERALAEFRSHRGLAEKLIAVGQSPHDARLDPVELAAATTTASLILNLDETVTKE